MDFNNPTYGQRRVRINTSDRGSVLDMKLLHAEIIDKLQSKRQELQAIGPENETHEAFLIRTSHLLSTIEIAMQDVEKACLIVVKAITVPS